MMIWMMIDEGDKMKMTMTTKVNDVVDGHGDDVDEMMVIAVMMTMAMMMTMTMMMAMNWKRNTIM